MARKGSTGSRARQAALTAVREALQRGEVPLAAPDLVEGDYGGFWVAPDGGVYVPSAKPLPRERAHARRASEVRLVVVLGGAGGDEPGRGEWRGTIPWNDDTSRLTHWRAADGSWLVIDEV